MKKGILKIAYKYILLLILAAVLCVSAVNARYGTGGSSTANTEIAAFGCSYTIDELSTTTFSNATWSINLSNLNSPQSIKFTVNNYIDDPNSPADVDVQAVFRFTVPYAFLSDVAVQMVQVDTTTTVETALTPQYDIKAIFSAISTAIAASSTATSTTFDTTNTDYNKISGATEQSLTVSWQYSGSNTVANITKITAINGDYTITLRKTSNVSDLMLSYTRAREDGSNANKSYFASELVVASTTTDANLQTLLTTWTLDISMPSLYFKTADGGTSKTFKMYFMPLSQQDYNACYCYENTNNLSGLSGAENVMYYAVTDSLTSLTTRTQNAVQLTIGDAMSATTYTGITVDNISYNETEVSLFSTADCNYDDANLTTGTVRVERSGSTGSYTYNYYYVDTSTNSYTEFSSVSGYDDVYSVTIDGTTYYLNVGTVGSHTASLHSTSACNDSNPKSGIVKVTKSGSTYSYYYTDVTAGTDTALTNVSGNVYSITIDTTTYYIDVSALGDNLINSPLYSYDGLATYHIGNNTTSGDPEIAGIYYDTYAQVVFIQASQVPSGD